MKREILIAGGLSAALATAAFVRPPRAVPAFSPAVMVSPSTPLASRSLRSGQATSNHRRYHARGHQTYFHGKSNTRARHRAKHIDLVDVNHADAATLARVPGITPDLARRIVAYRALVGGFATLDDLSDLDGISEGRLISLGRYLVVR